MIAEPSLLGRTWSVRASTRSRVESRGDSLGGAASQRVTFSGHFHAIQRARRSVHVAAGTQEEVALALVAAGMSVDDESDSDQPTKDNGQQTGTDRALRTSKLDVWAAVVAAACGADDARLESALRSLRGALFDRSPSAASRREAALELLPQLPARLLVDKVVHWSDERTGDTVLHVAAREGDAVACNVLLMAGAIPSKTNGRWWGGHTALQVAREAGQHDLLALLEPDRNFTSVCGGVGNAYEEAMEDEGWVVGVTWCTIPLPGWAGLAGGVHSLLKVTVSAEGGPLNIYTIEKTQRQQDTHPEAYQYGVLISFWKDVASMVGDRRPHAELRQADIRPELTMRDLRAEAVQLGKYDLGTNNCHHVAEVIFNFAARHEGAKRRMPNEWLSRVAGTLPESVVRGSPSASCGVKSTWYPTSRRQLAASTIDERAAQLFRRRRDYDAALLSEWVYVQDRPGAVNWLRFHNATDKELTVYVDGQRVDVKVDSGAWVCTAGGQAQVAVHNTGFSGYASSHTYHYTVPQMRAGWAVRMSPGARPTRRLPLQAAVVHPAADNDGVHWATAIADDMETLYVVFRGTDSLIDILRDVSCFPLYVEQLGLSVHTAAWAALNKRKDGVLSRVKAEVARLRSSHSVVLCGHSVGGGYALLTALEMLREGVHVDAVVAFGAPQVVVPSPGNALWAELNDISTVYVHALDAVPRSPPLRGWESGLHRLGIGWRQTLSGGAVVIGPDAGTLQRLAARLRSEIGAYDTIGELVLVGEPASLARPVRTDEARSHWPDLYLFPADMYMSGIEAHSMATGYLPTVERLCEAAEEAAARPRSSSLMSNRMTMTEAPSRVASWRP